MEILIVLATGILFGLCCNYYIASKLQPGRHRLAIALPLICMYAILPWQFTLINLRGTSTMVFMWLGSSKILLFCYDKGPLTTQWSKMSCLHFIIVATLPLNFSYNPNSSHLQQNIIQDLTISSVKTSLLFLIVYIYTYRSEINEFFIPLLFISFAYFGMNAYMSCFAILARTCLGIELEAQFDQPYLSSSLRDFWGRRWNLTVSSTLRQTVYDPVSFALSKKGQRPCMGARVAGLICSFTVSALFHELIFYLFTGAEPAGQVSAFFILQGFCVAAESALKGFVNRYFVVPRFISVPLTLCFLYVSGYWLFFPPIISSGVDVRLMEECNTFLEWLRHGNMRLLM